MKKLIVVVSIIVSCFLILISFNSVVGFFSTNNHQINDSPLFEIRSRRVQNLQPKYLTSQYIGKYSPNKFVLPTRNILKKDLLNELSEIDIQQKINGINQDAVDKWNLILMLAEKNLDEINKITREEYSEIRSIIDEYLKMSDEELKQEFILNLERINLQDEQLLSLTETKTKETVNFTSGPICNITSGPICQLTSQPICDLTSQPICNLITIMPMCLTLMGLRCPTAGLKCNKLPTTGTICTFLAKLGPILKAIAVILIIALIIFIPVIILVSVLNTNTCTNIREQITVAFNCTDNY
jgi:hypothetical protein